MDKSNMFNKSRPGRPDTSARDDVPDDIADSFAMGADENKFAEVIKELMDKGKIEMITDLSADEIKLITRIYMIAQMKNIPIWMEGLGIFMQLQLSKSRKSRHEMIDALRPIIQGEGQGNPLSRLFNGGRRY
jgi:hypothetical protein